MAHAFSRRGFLYSTTVVSCRWLLPALVPLAQHAVAEPLSLATLGSAEARGLEAIAARILPDGDTPGAIEGGVIHFIDGVLGSSRAELLEPLRAGLLQLNQAAWEHYGKDAFAALDPTQQDALLQRIETTPFFATMRQLTLAGMFALPQYGGNRDHAGWKLIGFDHHHAWQPPFGYYDADYMARGE